MNLNSRTAAIILHDVLVAAFAWLAAYWLQFHLTVPPESHASALSTLAWVVPLQAVVFWRFGLYRGIWRFASLPDLKPVLMAVGLSAVLILLVLVLFRVSAAVPRSVPILDTLLLVILMGGNRLAYHAWRGHRLAGLLHPASKPVRVEGAKIGPSPEDAPFEEFVSAHLDGQAYLDAYPDVKNAGIDPVKHWLEHGMAERRAFFPDAAVLHGDPAAQAEGSQWLRFTWRDKPVAIWIYDQAENALFAQFVETHMDREAYLDAYPDIRAAGMDPVKHWLEYGIIEGRFLYPGATVIVGDVAAKFDDAYWKRFTWRGKPVAVRKKVPIKPSLLAQIKAQARHEPAVLAAGDLAIGSLRQLIGPDLLGRSGIDVRSIFAATPEQPDVVVLIPHLRVNDAEKFTADLINGLTALGHANILVIVTKDTAKAAAGWESHARLAPFRKVRVVFWRDICGLHYEDPHHFARWLRVLRPSRILVINSRLGLEMVGKYGRGLSHIAGIYCVYFGFGLHGADAHYAARFPYRTLPFSVGLTDNETMAAALRRLWGELPGPGIAVLPPRLDPADELVFSARLEARQTRTENTSRSLNWVWFSRGDTFDDGATLLTELARMRPTDQFDFFELVKGDLNKMRLNLSNIKDRGVLPDVSSADLSGYDGVLVTGLFEGMPGFVLQLSQHATPMVLPDVGGLRDTFDATSAIFVQLDQDKLSVAAAFARALESVASLTSSEALDMAEAARAQALARHAPEVYLKHLANIFEIPVSHV